jgi:hypothetical protein
MAALPANYSLSSLSLIVNRLPRSIFSLLAVYWAISASCCRRQRLTSRNARSPKPIQSGWSGGSVAPNLDGTSPIIAPSTAPRSFQRSARFAYRTIFELVIVNIFGSPGTAQSSRSALFTEHRWSHAAQPKSFTTALRPRQACRYIDRVA